MKKRKLGEIYIFFEYIRGDGGLGFKQRYFIRDNLCGLIILKGSIYGYRCWVISFDSEKMRVNFYLIVFSFLQK